MWSTSRLPLVVFLAACTPEAPVDPCDPGDICRVIGTGDLGFNGDGLPAADTWLYFPSAVRFHPDGRLVVMDFNNMRMRAVQPDGTLLTIAGSGNHGGSAPGSNILDSALDNPIDMAFLPDGSFYIDPLHESRVLYVDTDGIIHPYAGTGDEGCEGDGGPATEAWLTDVGGIVRGDDGTLYLADTGNNSIRAVDPGGIIRTLAGTIEPGLVDGVGAEARFSGPQRLDYADGLLYVADANNHAIRTVDTTTGAVTTIAGTGTRGYSGDGGAARQAELSFPYGVTVEADGTLTIADSDNNVLRRVATDGTITTIAGTGEPGLSGDEGPATEATLGFPVHTVTHDGDLYVAEMKNGVVRRIVGGE